MTSKLGILLALISSGLVCFAQTGKSSLAAPPKASAAESPDPPKPASRPYIIGPLDVLDIRVWNDTKISGMFPVRPDGVISMPLIGELKAEGLTIPELTKVIKEKLAESVTNDAPDVNIQPTRINSQRIFVHGAVNKQGEVPLTGEMTNPRRHFELRRVPRFCQTLQNLRSSRLEEIQFQLQRRQQRQAHGAKHPA